MSTNGPELKLSKLQDYSDRLIPLGKRILVKRAKAAMESEGGIALPEATVSEVKNPYGQILKISEELVEDDTCPLAPGDWVFFPTFVGMEFEIGNSTYIIMESEDVMCILAQEEHNVDES